MKKKSGFTLLEVLVVIGILSVFLLSAVTVSIVSVRNLKNSENKILASRYAEGLIEWLRGEKESDWTLFILKEGTWCFNDEPITQWPQSGTCGPEDANINNNFKREVIIDYDDISRVLVKVSVSWNEGDETITIPISTLFEQYD